MNNENNEQEILDNASQKYEENGLGSAPIVDSSSGFVLPSDNNPPQNNASAPQNNQNGYAPSQNGYAPRNNQNGYAPSNAAQYSPSLKNAYGVGSILGLICLNAIPVAGFITMILFACGIGQGNRPERRNLAIALLIFRGIVFAALLAFYQFFTFLLRIVALLAGA